MQSRGVHHTSHYMNIEQVYQVSSLTYCLPLFRIVLLSACMCFHATHEHKEMTTAKTFPCTNMNYHLLLCCYNVQKAGTVPGSDPLQTEFSH